MRSAVVSATPVPRGGMSSEFDAQRTPARPVQAAHVRLKRLTGRIAEATPQKITRLVAADPDDGSLRLGRNRQRSARSHGEVTPAGVELIGNLKGERRRGICAVGPECQGTRRPGRIVHEEDGIQLGGRLRSGGETAHGLIPPASSTRAERTNPRFFLTLTPGLTRMLIDIVRQPICCIASRFLVRYNEPGLQRVAAEARSRCAGGRV